jgi:RNA polymerase sigma factor (sigma-70 family)
VTGGFDSLMEVEMSAGAEQGRQEEHARHLRRVVIEERQQRVIDHARSAAGYAEDVDPHAHNRETFRLINQRKELDGLPGAEYIVPALDDWKFWTKMKDWDSRNALLEQLTSKLRRREISHPELHLLVIVCGPAWRGVVSSLRSYGGADLDPAAEGRRSREEATRVNRLDRAELDQVVQDALLEALGNCPRPFPRHFFAWLKRTLSYRALDHIRADLGEQHDQLPHDRDIAAVVDAVLTREPHRESGAFSTPASPGFSQWLRTRDLESIFELAREYSSYARISTACERAVERLPDRQRRVVEDRYFKQMTQQEIADSSGLAASSVRNSHRGAMVNLRADDDLFDVLQAVGKVRDLDRRMALDAQRGLRPAA